MVWKSPYAQTEIPDQSLPAFVLERAAEFGDKPALIDGPSGRTLTFNEVLDGARSVAAGLAERGFGKGDVFGLYLPNLPEYAGRTFAPSCARTGGGKRTCHHVWDTPADSPARPRGVSDDGARWSTRLRRRSLLRDLRKPESVTTAAAGPRPPRRHSLLSVFARSTTIRIPCRATAFGGYL